MSTIKIAGKRIKRVLAGGLCLLVLWRPLRAEDGIPVVNTPPEAHGEQQPQAELPQAEAPIEQTAPPAEPPAADTAPPAQPTPEGEQTAADETVPPTPWTTEAATDTPTEAPAAEATPGGTIVEPGNAHEDAAFSRGYAVLLGADVARLKAHARPSSYPVVALAAEEVIWVDGRVPYISTKKERQEQEQTGDVFADWFLVRARDAEGTIVEGYVSGYALLPLTAEEAEALRLLWQEEKLPQAEDGIPLIAGTLLPPPEDAEQTPEPTDEADEDSDENDEDASGATQTPTTPDATETPEGLETQPTPTQKPPENVDTLADALLQAEQLLADGEEFAAKVEATVQAHAMAMSLATPDITAPTILDVQIIYDALGGPNKKKAVLSIAVTDEKDPADPNEEVSGIAEVYVTDPSGKERSCSYDDSAKRFVLTVYQGGTYVVGAKDLVEPQPNVSNPTDVVVDQTLLQPSNPKDTKGPQVAPVVCTPQVEMTEAVTVEVDAVDMGDPTDPTEAEPSGITEVWAQVNGWRIPFVLDPETLLYKGEVFDNGTHTVWVKDAAGNTSTQTFTIANILDGDTHPPIIDGVLRNPEDDQKNNFPMVELSVRVVDVPKPESNERATGVERVQIGWYIGDDEQTGEPQAYGLEDMYQVDEDRYATYLEENGEFVIVATDFAGNRSVQRQGVNYIGEYKPRTRDPNWEFRPVDDDGDGLFTQTEYRLGINPANRDTNGDGLWDGLCVRLGLDPNGRNATPSASVLSRAKDASMLDALVAAGQLEAPVSERNPGTTRRKTQDNWSKQRTSVVWMDPQGNTMLCINNGGLFTVSIPRSETVQVEQALSLSVLQVGLVNNNVARTIETSADGSLALLYDRGIHGGELRKDAYLIDTTRMQAYRIPNTAGARGLAISDDGAYVAIWKNDELMRINLQTGEVFRCDDADRCSRIEMLRFMPDNRLVTRVSSIGYNALALDGTQQVGNAEALPCLVQFQDLREMTIFDRNMSPIRIKAQALLRSTGIYFEGEVEKDKAVRNLSPRNMYERALGPQDAQAKQ